MGQISTKEEYSKFNAEYTNRHAILNRFLESLLHWDINEDPNNFRWELIDELFSIFWRFLLGNVMMRDRGMPKALMDSQEHIDFFAKIYTRKYTESGKKKEDLQKISNRSIRFDPPS